MRDIAEMFAIIRPMKESTISSAEMSIRTPFGVSVSGLRRQIVLERQRQLVVHVDLDGDEQELAHPQDRNSFHRCPRRLRRFTLG